MRTTIEMPNVLLHQIKVHVVERGDTLKDFMVRAAERELERSIGRPSTRREISFPLISSSEPGKLASMTNGEIDEILG